MIFLVGEALLDILDSGDGAPKSFVGGSPLNVAVTLARLGIGARLLTTLGNDDEGNRIRAYLAENDVELAELGPPSSHTSTAKAILDANGVATYDFQIEWVPQQITVAKDEAVAVHTGSLATALFPGAELVVQALKDQHERGDVTLTYDPNVRPALIGERSAACSQVESIVGMVDVVKASDEDLRWLYPGEDFHEIAKRWINSGPAIVIVTCGNDGAFAVTKSHSIHVEAPPVPVVDTVGAGDSFMGATLFTLEKLNLLGGSNRDALYSIDEAALRLIMERAIEVANVTVSRAGANPPRISEVSFS